MFDIFYKKIKKQIAKLEEKQNYQNIINNQTLKTLQTFDEDIKNLEKLVNSVPIIKRYQKTLDILEKATKNKSTI